MAHPNVGVPHTYSETMVKRIPNTPVRIMERKIHGGSAQKFTHLDEVTREIAALEVIEGDDGLVAFAFVCEHEGDVIIRRPFVTGRSLAEIMADTGGLDKSAVIHIALNIATLMELAHQKGVALGNLKLENCIFQNGSTKIVDFGMKFLMMDTLSNDTTVYNLAMRGPEGVRGNPQASKELDIWQFGILLYALASGALPWKSRNQGLICRDMVSGKVPISLEIHPEVRAVIQMALVSDPAARATGSAIIHKLMRAQSTLPMHPILPRAVKQTVMSMSNLDDGDTSGMNGRGMLQIRRRGQVIAGTGTPLIAGPKARSISGNIGIQLGHLEGK